MDPFIFLFSLFLIILAFGILRSWQIKNVEDLKYSILIACRNEEANLPRLFDSLKNLDYPKNSYEIIIVNDASSDGSLELIKRFCNGESNAKYFHLEKKSKEYLGKKAALKIAAENAKFEILLFTDADCFPKPNWIKSYNKYISDRTGFVIGSYKEINVSPFHRFCNQISSAIYASTTGLGFPFSAAGGNMAVRKEALEQVKGYERIKHNLAGDDKQLLNLIKETDWEIRYNPEILISTISDQTNSHHRKKRKYGKFGMSSSSYKLISIVVLLFYVYLPINIFIGKEWINLIGYFVGAILFWIANIIKHNFKFLLIDLFFIVIYPYYLIYYSALGILGNWKWKN